MIERTFNPSFLNQVANNPEVHPWLGAEGPIDLAPLILDTANCTLVTEHGGFVVVRHDDGLYEVHSLFVPGSRAAIRAMREGMEYMFLRTDCERLVTQVPDNNAAARGLARIGGFRESFRREDTPRGPTSYQVITIEDWALGNASLEATGHWFHERLEAAKEKAGSSLPVHPDDPAHERTVGAALRMIQAGNVQKGVRFYNRWALFAGYAPISLISENPLAVDVVDAVVSFSRDELEILLCR